MISSTTTELASSTASTQSWLNRINMTMARYGMYLVVAGLLAIIAIVAWQVFGRYVLNKSPTWAENLALVLVLYVTMVGAAVGVRDSGHVGLDSLLTLLPARMRLVPELLIHVVVAAFALAMVYNGWVLGSSVAAYRIPNLGFPEVVRYVPLVLAGVLILSFSIEHIIALLRGEEVPPSWN